MHDRWVLRPWLYKVLSIYRTYGIYLSLPYSRCILQHTDSSNDSCICWYLLAHTKGSHLWPITTCVTHIISVNPGLNVCFPWQGTGLIVALATIVCRVSEANRTSVRYAFAITTVEHSTPSIANTDPNTRSINRSPYNSYIKNLTIIHERSNRPLTLSRQHFPANTNRAKPWKRNLSTSITYPPRKTPFEKCLSLIPIKQDTAL